MTQQISAAFGALAIAGAVTLAVPTEAQADYPTQPIEVIIPYAPGGATDTAARVFLPKLGEILGQPVVIQNMPGSAGNIGAGNVARADPDGYTLLLTVNPPVSLNKFIFADLPYDPATDFAPISMVAQTLLVFAAHESFPPNTVEEVIEYARANPGQVRFGSSGYGSAHHIAGSIINLESGIEMVHIPYQGGGPAVQDLVGGHIETAFATLPSLAPHAESGTIKFIALAELERYDEMPDLPTIAETVPGVGMTTWLGLLAPAGTPDDIIAQLNAATIEALQDPMVQQGLANSGLVPVSSTPEEFLELIMGDLTHFEVLLPQIGIEPQ